MTKKQQENEVKYRLSIIMLLELKHKGQITNEEFVEIRKKLIRKYKPIIGCLEMRH